jgi:SAM-dependent methyltransferase
MGTEEVLAEQVAYYRARAPEYDDWWQRRRGYDLGEQVTSAWRDDAALLRDALDGFAPRGQVLELAAGTGIWTGELLRHADRVLAVDAAPEALAINRAKHAGRPVDYVVADLFSWTPPRRFDAVCFGFWLSHVPAASWTGFWALVDRALAPGGRVWFCDNAHPEHTVAHGPQAYHDRADRPEGRGRANAASDGSRTGAPSRSSSATGTHLSSRPSWPPWAGTRSCATPRGRSSTAAQPAPRRITTAALTQRRPDSSRRSAPTRHAGECRVVRLPRWSRRACTTTGA